MKEPRVYLVHQKPHSLKKKNVVVSEGDKLIIAQKITKGNKHTRRTVAGRYLPESKQLIVGVAGNHLSDAFDKSVGAEKALERIEKESKYLQAQKKQFIINDVEPDAAGKTFFSVATSLQKF